MFLFLHFQSRNVLNLTPFAGHKSYLVGGSVRDLLVKQIPKDFDILTTAEPKQVSNLVRSCVDF